MKRFFCTFTCTILLFVFLSGALPASLTLSFPAAAAGLNADNLWDFNASYCGYYDDGGKAYYSHLYQTSADITASKGDVFTAGPFLEKQEIYASAFDAQGKLIERITDIGKLTKTALPDGVGFLCSYTVPDKCASVRFTCSASVFASFVITKNKAFSAAEYSAFITANGYEKYEAIRCYDKSASSGKSLLWCGDSVGAGSYEFYYEGAANAGLTSKNKTTKTPSWAGRVSALLGVPSYTNSSQGGATYCSGKHKATNIPTQLSQNASAKYDYIVIEGGTVDVGGYNSYVVPLGYITDSYTPDGFAPDTTFLGGLERAFYAATTKAPDAVIICVIPYSAPSNKNYNYGWERLYQYIPYVCEKWGIPCVNLYLNDTVNSYFDYDRSYGGKYYYDALHCTPLGYTVTAAEIASVLMNSEKYSVQNRKMPSSIPAIMTEDGYSEPNVKGGGTLEFSENQYKLSFESKGVPDKDLKLEKTGTYKTSGFVKVNAGNTVYFGPCSPYEECQLVGYDASQKAVTGRLDSTYLGLVSVLNSGYIIYSYTVPDNVKYVKVSFLSAVAPVITVNKPFDAGYYNAALLAKANKESISRPDTYAPITTPAVVVTEEKTVPPVDDTSSISSSETACDTTAEAGKDSSQPELTSGSTGSSGCRSAISFVYVCISLMLVYAAKKKE